MKSENSDTRLLLANALSLHENEILENMSNLKESQSELFLSNLVVLFYLLSDPESQIGLKIMKIFLNIADISLKKHQTELFFLSHGSEGLFEKGLTGKNDVVKMR